MKLTSIKVTNFKSFEKLELQNFLSLNFIFGFNNSGKSNLLKFIDTIFSRKVLIQSVGYESNEGLPETRSVRSSGSFWDGIIENHNYIFRFGKNIEIEFSITVELDSTELNSLPVYNELLKARTIKKAKQHSLQFSGRIRPLGSVNAIQELTTVTLDGTLVFDELASPSSSVDINELMSVMNDSVLFIDYDRYLKKEVEDKKVTELVARQFRNWFFNLSLSDDRNSEFNDAVAAFRNFKIASTDKKFVDNEKSNPFGKNFDYRFSRKDDNLELLLKNEFGEIPLSSFGTGVQQIIYMLFQIFDKKPKILLLEEIELNLSPKYQDVLIKFLENLSKGDIKQAFITSHSPLHCYRSQDRAYLTNIDTNGNTKIEKFILNTAENRKLKAAHDFLIKSFYQ